MSTDTALNGTGTPTRSGPARTPARRRRRGSLPYGLLLPALVALLVGLGYPLARQVVLSFQDFGLAQQFGQPAKWIGLANYRELVTDRYLWTVALRSLAFCFANAGITMVLGIAIALLLQRLSTPVRILVQIGLLLAWAMPVIAVLTVFEWMFDAQYGVVNWVLERLGADYAGHSWLLQPLSFYVVAALVVVWMSVPFVAFTVYAALTGVPEEMVEASEIDGAGPLQRLVYIILPTIRPVLLVVGLLQIIWDMRVFTQIYVLQQAGGITQDTNLLGTYIYRIGIGESRFGMAAAIAMFMLVLTAVLTAPYIRSMLRTERDT
jgi:N,N'-diacetylchitobiose transport system permease protein